MWTRIKKIQVETDTILIKVNTKNIKIIKMIWTQNHWYLPLWNIPMGKNEKE